MSQARSLYGRLRKKPELKDKLVTLASDGWTIGPNLHFCYIGTILHANTGVSMTPEEYLEYWISHLDEIREVKRDGFESYYKELLEKKMASPEDIEQLKKHFSETTRDHLRPCPGLEVYYTWSRKEAIQMDDKNRFQDEVRKKIVEGLDMLGEDPGMFQI
jgi:hypothetical protein